MRPHVAFLGIVCLLGFFAVVSLAIPAPAVERTQKTALFLVQETARRTESAAASSNPLLAFKSATEACALSEALLHITSDENLKREHATTAHELSTEARAQQTMAMGRLERTYPSTVAALHGANKVAAGWAAAAAPAEEPVGV